MLNRNQNNGSIGSNNSKWTHARRYYFWVLLIGAFASRYHRHIQHCFHEFTTSSQHEARLRLNLHEHVEGYHNLYFEAFYYYNASRYHRWKANRRHQHATELDHRLYKEETEAEYLHERARSEWHQTLEDAREYSLWIQQERLEERQGRADLYWGQVLANRSKVEMEEAEAMLKEAREGEKLAAKELEKAKQELEDANHLRIHPEYLDTSNGVGLCRYAPFACYMVRQNSKPEDQFDALDRLVVQASLNLQNAIQDQDRAKAEHDQGMQLYYKAMYDGNASISLLHDADVVETEISEAAKQAEAYREQAIHDLNEFWSDEKKAKAEDKEIEEMQQQSEELHTEAKEDMKHAIQEAHRLKELEELLWEEKIEIYGIENQLNSTVEHALSSVAGANWYALKSMVFAMILLVYVSRRIARRVEEENPMYWIIREQPFTARDSSYLFNHVLHFVLSIAFIGEILADFGISGIAGKLEILFFFSIWSALLQAMLLHLVPHVLHVILGLQDDHLPTLKKLLWEDVVKRGVLFFALFLMEILICVCLFGQHAFWFAYKLNGWWLWILVALAFVAHVYVFGTLAIYYDDVYHAPSADTIPLTTSEGEITASQSPDEVVDVSSEMSSFVSSVHGTSTISGVTGDSSFGLYNVNLGSSSIGSETLHQQYGSLEQASSNTNRQSLSASTELVVSKFVTSMPLEVSKLTFLFDILLFCWCFLILRTDAYVIHRLSKVPQDLVWAKFPGWILSLFLWSFVGFTSFWCRQNQSRVQSIARAWLSPKEERAWTCTIET